MAESEPKLDEKTSRSLKFSTIEGAMYNVMAGFTEYFINPFAIALGASNPAIGLMRSLPPLLVSISQPFSFIFSNLFKTRKGFIMTAVLLQSIALIFLLSIPYLFKENTEIMLLFFFALFSVFAPLANPVWTSWMADLVPDGIRGRYFGNRNMVGGIATFIAIVAGGFILMIFGSGSFLGFTVLFTLASIFRLISFISFTKIDEPPRKNYEAGIAVFSFIKEIRNNEFGVFLLYYFLLIFSTAIAGFFFSVYMIRDLAFSYETYAFIEAGFTLSLLFSNSYWGKVIDKFGNKLVLSVCGLLVPFIPLIWLASKNPAYIFCFEIFSGFAWAGINLALFNYVMGFGSLKNKTAQYAANFNFFQGIAVFLGGIIGAFMVSNINIYNVSGIPLVFISSGLLRLVCGLAFLPLIKEYKSVTPFHGNALMNFGVYMPARRFIFYANEAFQITGKTAKKAVSKIKYKFK